MLDVDDGAQRLGERDIIHGLGGDQALIEDPPGNAIALFTPSFRLAGEVPHDLLRPCSGRLRGDVASMFSAIASRARRSG